MLRNFGAEFRKGSNIASWTHPTVTRSKNVKEVERTMIQILACFNLNLSFFESNIL